MLQGCRAEKQQLLLLQQCNKLPSVVMETNLKGDTVGEHCNKLVLILRLYLLRNNNVVMSLMMKFVILVYLSVSCHSVQLVTVSSDKHLKCYQCKSNSISDIPPLCDHTFWKVTTKAEKLSMQLSCPHKQSHYCVKKVIWKNNIVLTDRGCQRPADKLGTVRKEGCMHMGKQNTTICLCNSDLCNYADWGTKSAPFTIFGLCSFVLFSR